MGRAGVKDFGRAATPIAHLERAALRGPGSGLALRVDLASGRVASPVHWNLQQKAKDHPGA